MEALLNWLLGSLGWDALKKLLSRDASGVQPLIRALKEVQDRNAELEQDRELMARLVEQRNLLHAQLTEMKRRMSELEQECASLRAAAGKRSRKTKQ